MRILILKDDDLFKHSTNWSNVWIDYSKKHNLDFEVLSPYSSVIIPKLKDFDICLWHFSNYLYTDMVFARSILSTAKALGLSVFPDYGDSWHFDDKVAQSYLLDSIGSNIPKYWVFNKKNEAIDWLSKNANYPLVSKLKGGSGSHHVKLLSSKRLAIAYTKKMFSRGISPRPSFIFKANSNIRSSNTKSTFINRFKRIPEFIRTLRNAKMFPNEKSYVYFQEFIPNASFDIKVVVIKDKISCFGRNVRVGDFRASGGGDVFYDKSILTKDLMEIAFETSAKINSDCMGYDFVIDERDNKYKIVEMSYGFSNEVLLGASGYFDREHVWHNSPLNAPIEILKNLLQR